MTSTPAGAPDRLREIARRVMRERDLLPEFAADAQAEADALAGPVRSADAVVVDLRDRLWASIDNDDSLDLDQLSVAAALPDGAVQVLVAIADVDAAVPKGSAIDRHAAHNTTSVYTAAQVFPMLPERLSTNLTSLAEDQDRLSIVIDMTIDARGVVGESRLYRALVRNRAKLAYDGVAAWLGGAAAAPAAVVAVHGMAEQLRLQQRVAILLKNLRHAHGALTLETREARPVFEAGQLRDLVPDVANRAKELIEDFMIAANTATARYLDGRHLPSLRRVLLKPERWNRIAAVAAAFGTRLPDAPSAPELNAFLLSRRQQDPAGFEDLSLTIVKLLGRGEYVLERPGAPDPGHFGLAISDYTHSTAPNRRFPDVITQRLVKAALAGAAAPYTEQELAALAAQCTRQEDNAAKVERSVRKSAAALLLSSRVGRQFDGIVTGASPKGIWVRISAPTTEGRIVKGYAGLEVGDRVRVELVHTDVERGFIDFAKVA
jgi:exoribonuclease-2